MAGLELPPAALDLFGSNLLLPIAGAAAILAALGLILLLPLYFTQRREVVRLLDWMDREPERGDQGSPQLSAGSAVAATAGATAPPPGRAAPPVPATGSTGRMTPAERVTSDRPALARITTAEQAAIEAAPPWRRILIRGPRHPFVLAIAALLVAALIFGAFVTFLRPGENESAKGVDRTSVSVVVVNASSSSGLADDVANGVEAADFIVAGTDVAAETSSQSVVQYAQGSKSAAKSVAKRLKIKVVQPFDPESEAASLEADGADVVVIAGEDRARDLAGGG